MAKLHFDFRDIFRVIRLDGRARRSGGPLRPCGGVGGLLDPLTCAHLVAGSTIGQYGTAMAVPGRQTRQTTPRFAVVVDVLGMVYAWRWSTSPRADDVQDHVPAAERRRLLLLRRCLEVRQAELARCPDGPVATLALLSSS